MPAAVPLAPVELGKQPSKPVKPGPLTMVRNTLGELVGAKFTAPDGTEKTITMQRDSNGRAKILQIAGELSLRVKRRDGEAVALVPMEN